MSEHVPGLENPPRCGRCLHTVRDGEAFEDRMWETNSAGPMPGVAHTMACPELVVVPCPPCLHALLEGQLDKLHVCEMATVVAVEGTRLVVGTVRDCPCRCQVPVQESRALRAARAAARGTADE